MHSLPSNRSIRAFEAAARLHSYSRAAEELGVTHGAVSHAIRDLERRLGSPLFQRQGNAMVPTMAANRILPTIRHALELLSNVFPAARRAGPVQIRLSVLPSLASHWLVGRLADFHLAHPDIAITLDSTLELAAVGPKGVDAAIRFGEGNWPDVQTTRLIGETAFPVCSPVYRDRHKIGTPADLAGCRLLRHSWQPWIQWFQIAGLALPEPSSPPPYDDAGLMLDAAKAGAGVALGRKLLVSDSLAAGTLVRLFDQEIALGASYYFIQPLRHSASAESLSIFEAWLLNAIRTAP